MASDASRSPRPHGRDRATAWKLGSGDDIELTLSAAERLLGHAEERRRHAQNRTFAVGSLAFGTTLSAFVSALALAESISYGFFGFAAVGAILSLLVGFLVAAVAARWIVRQRYVARFDYSLRLAAEMAGLVGELYGAIAEKEDWSYLRVQSTRLRLSVFPLVDEVGARR